jgi:hypothetical protein
MGQAFATELRWRGYGFIPLTREAMNYSDFNLLFDHVRKLHLKFISQCLPTSPPKMCRYESNGIAVFPFRFFLNHSN